MDKLKIKGKGKSPTKKDYLINYVERLIQTGKWTDEVNDQLLQRRWGVGWRLVSAICRQCLGGGGNQLHGIRAFRGRPVGSSYLFLPSARLLRLRGEPRAAVSGTWSDCTGTFQALSGHGARPL